jgi:hypothetical protein
VGGLDQWGFPGPDTNRVDPLSRGISAADTRFEKWLADAGRAWYPFSVVSHFCSGTTSARRVYESPAGILITS